MKLTERHEFKTSTIQKKTLTVLHDKYHFNTSEFIRNAIKEKLERDKESIFSKLKEVKQYLKDENNCPF